MEIKIWEQLRNNWHRQTSRTVGQTLWSKGKRLVRTIVLISQTIISLEGNSLRGFPVLQHGGSPGVPEPGPTTMSISRFVLIGYPVSYLKPFWLFFKLQFYVIDLGTQLEGDKGDTKHLQNSTRSITIDHPKFGKVTSWGPGCPLKADGSRDCHLIPYPRQGW